MKLNVITEGEGRDLVLLHGWGLHAGIWDSIIPTLRGEFAGEPVSGVNFRVHRVNLPGYGGSVYEACTPEQIVEALAEQLPKQVIVCGWSLGAQITMRWALQFPTQIEKLILVSATPCFMQRTGWESAMSPAMFANFAQGLDKDASTTLQRFSALVAHGYTQARRMLPLLRDALTPMPALLALGAGLTWLAQTDLRKDVAHIQMPALVIHGAHDAIAPVQAGQWLAEKMLAARFELFADASHAPFLSHPEHFTKLLTEFCNEQ